MAAYPRSCRAASRPAPHLSTAASTGAPTDTRRIFAVVLGGLMLTVGLLLGVLGVFFGAGAQGTAHADNTLTATTPADKSSLGSSPTSLMLNFGAALGPNNAVVVTCNGNPFAVGQPTVGADAHTLTVTVPNPMPKGTCNVAATVSATDSRPNGTVTFSFSITADTVVTSPPTTVAGASSSTAATTTPATGTGSSGSSTGTRTEAAAPKVGGPLGLARVAATLGLAVLLGAIALIVVAWPEGVEYVLTVRFLRTAWIVGFAGSVLMVILMTAQVTGRSVGASLSPSAWVDLKDTGPGAAALARAAFAAGCGWVVIRPERAIDQQTQLASIAVPAIAVATFGFSRSGGDLPALGALMGMGHAIAMALWLGGIVLLTRVVLAGPGDEDLVHAVRGFGRIAFPALVATVVTGLVQTWRLDRGSLFGTGHGRVLLLKALVVSATVFVAVATRQFVRAKLGDRHASDGASMTAPLAARLRRATGIEALGGVAVIALTAWMLALAPGGLKADAATAATYRYTDGRIVSAENDFDVTVQLTGVVGRNGVLVEIAQPQTGLSNLTITFQPPQGSGVAAVVLTLPSTVTGRGAAVLAASEGIPLDVAGVWTLQVKGTTTNGERSGQKAFTLPT